MPSPCWWSLSTKLTTSGLAFVWKPCRILLPGLPGLLAQCPPCLKGSTVSYIKCLPGNFGANPFALQDRHSRDSSLWCPRVRLWGQTAWVQGLAQPLLRYIWASYSTSLGIDFFLCKMWRFNEIIFVKCMATGKCLVKVCFSTCYFHFCPYFQIQGVFQSSKCVFYSSKFVNSWEENPCCSRNYVHS